MICFKWRLKIQVIILSHRVTLANATCVWLSAATWDAAEGISEPSIVNNEITWEVGDLMAGAQGTIEIWLDIESDIEIGTPLEHLAEIEIQPEEEDIENNSSLMTEMVYGDGHNLRIWKDGWTEGEVLGYHLYVENVGNENVDDVYILDFYDDKLDLNSGVDNVNSNYELDWDVWDLPAESKLTIHLAKLGPGWGADINYSMVIPGGLVAGLVFENNAEIHPTTGESHPEDN